MEIQFHDGFITEYRAKRDKRDKQGWPYLWTGRQAEVGQLIDTSVTINDKPMVVYGLIVEVGSLPTMDEWKPPMCNCGLPLCRPFDTLTMCEKELLRERKLAELGTLNGQTMVAFVYVCPNYDFYYPWSDFIYKMSYVADESKTRVWQVTNVEVADETDLPQLFKDWSAGVSKIDG